MTIGPGGDLFVSVYNSGQVLRFDGTTGATEGVFASGLSMSPNGLVFGPDGDLFVADGFANQVVRFDGTTGVLKGVFASADGGYGLAQGYRTTNSFIVNEF